MKPSDADFHLTKSQYVTGISCPRLLWTKLNRPQTLPPLDEATIARMSAGTEVGSLARDLFTDALGIITRENKLALSLTSKYIKERKPLFEAAFQANIAGVNCLARVDILNPIGKDSWELIEVKSSTKVKEEHLHDIAFQAQVLESAGIKVHACSLMHVNKEYIFKDKLNLEEFLTKEDITQELPAYLDVLEDNIQTFKEQLAQDKPIDILCPSPKDCPACQQVLPENSVFDLFYHRGLAHSLYERGIKTIDKIPPSTSLSTKQQVQYAALISNQPQIKRKPIKEFLESLHYPLYFFDFETYSPIIPKYNNTHPYQRIPFQYSLHNVKESGELNHKEFLAPSNTEDPRPALLKQMKDDFNEEGDILVYHAPFETSVLKELANDFPEYEDFINKLLPRIIDLATPFKDFNLYHPQQHGKYSIKAVLPAFTDITYDNLTINNGDLASAKFYESIHNEQEREQIRTNLLQYCKQDTQAMVALLDVLKKF